MEAEAGEFALAPIAAHAAGKTDSQACFRVNLALLALQTTEELGGKTSAAGRDLFCLNTRGARIETVEHYCGRSSLDGYLDGFRENVWIYQHQRCPGWESPDANGDQEPGLDYLAGVMDKTTGA